MPLLAAFLIGLAIGAVAARSHFCTMGALSDLFLFGSRRRLRGLVVAAATALAGSCLLALLGVPVFAPTATVPWLAVIVGSFAFGAGMTLSGGCITRNLTRAGQGSFRAAATLCTAVLAAAAVATGIMAPVGNGLASLAVHLPQPGALLPFLGLPLAAGAVAWCLLPAKERNRAKGDLLAGCVLGLMVPLWHLLVVPAPMPISPAFLLPATDLLRLVVSAGPLQPGVLLVLGMLAGAAAMALQDGTARFETFADRADVARHLAGALLMGLGGGVLGTCSFGLIVSGIGALLPASFLGTIALALGCRQTLRVLEGRSFFSR
jgi:uncharacterized membrane protein YedE/YeeE